MVLPIRDVNPVHRTPWVTYALVAVNLVVFVLSPLALSPLLGEGSLARQCEVSAYLDRWAAVPAELYGDPPAAVATGEVGATPAGAGCVVVSPPPYEKSGLVSAVTAMFVHGGWLHLLGNLLFLAVFGNNVEDRLGRLRFLAFYLGCGLVATYGFALAAPGSTQPLVGASGAIAGVLGAYLMLFPRARVWGLLTFLLFLPVRLPAWVVLGSWFVVQYAYARGAGLAEGGVAYLAHVIGFAVGALLVARVSPRRRPGRRPGGP